MRHRLDGAMFYLAGPMDDVDDRGAGWRKEMAEYLWTKNIGVLCPYNKPIYGGIDEDEEYFNEINWLKKIGQYQKAHDLMKQVAADDYRMVDKADALILYIDRDAHMCGSYHENCMAAYQRKPVMVACKQGVEAIPNWMFSISRHELFFNTIGEIKAYIEYLCHAKDPETYNRWRFFDYDRIFNRK